MTQLEFLIAIQARSTSTRFPRKIYEYIGERMMLQHVIDTAVGAATWVNRNTTGLRGVMINCRVAVLHPENDSEIPVTFRTPGCSFYGGPEHDVLTRYVNAREQTDADYVVRLTSDCPLMLQNLISKHINLAAFSPKNRGGKLDYVADIEEQCRTIADGLDCEVMSAKALRWLDTNATSKEDREHVTKAIRRLRPASLTAGHVITQIDTSDIKMSVDTPEDLERVRAIYERRKYIRKKAELLYGSCVYEF